MSELPFVRERPPGTVATPIPLATLRTFDAVIDARSPGEFAEDHLPGAINCPVLDDAERSRVGTIYKQSGAFEAKRVGAALVARNIAHHIESRFAGQPRDWRPLAYCWRGGGRSGSLAHVLRQVGWDCATLEGGYKAFRRQVAAELETMPEPFTLRIVCGATGTGKSRLLEALAEADAQVLDLEGLAAHRGSILGELPGSPQPSQKAFETAIWTALSAFDPKRPVFVESESRKVGNLRVPARLMECMRASACVTLEARRDTRVALLLEEYAHFVAQPAALVEKIACLAPLHGKEAIERWKEQVGSGQWRELVADLLDNHYDPAYHRSMSRNYAEVRSDPPIAVNDVSRAGFAALARHLLLL